MVVPVTMSIKVFKSGITDEDNDSRRVIVSESFRAIEAQKQEQVPETRDVFGSHYNFFLLRRKTQ